MASALMRALFRCRILDLFFNFWAPSVVKRQALQITGQSAQKNEFSVPTFDLRALPINMQERVST